MLKRKWRLAVVATGSILIAAGCSMPGDDGGDAAKSETAPAAEQAPADEGAGAGDDAGAEGSAGGDGTDAQSKGPNLDDIPDPVAEVNGSKVTKDEFVSVFEGQFQQMSMQAQSSGQPVDEEKLKEQSIEGLVGAELLEQEAEKRGLKASDKEIDASLAEFAKTNQVSTDEFVAKMGEQGMDRAAVMDQIEKQLIVEKLIDDEYGEFTPSDKEVQAAYDQVSQQQSMMGGAQGGQTGGQQLPPLEQVRPQVEEQVKSEKQAQNMQSLSEKLRKDADVTVHL